MAGTKGYSSFWSWEYKDDGSILREIKNMYEKDYYSILGLQINCSSGNVKKAYMKLSLKVHPDKNKSPEGERVFKIISEAYQRLKAEKLGIPNNTQPQRYHGWENIPTPSNFATGVKKKKPATDVPEFKCFGVVKTSMVVRAVNVVVELLQYFDL